MTEIYRGKRLRVVKEMYRLPSGREKERVVIHPGDAAAMLPCRGFEDDLYGVAYPLAGRGLSQEQEVGVRLASANLCLGHAAKRTPYNLNFLNANTIQAFYCSQLAYKAYLPHGIDLNTGCEVPAVSFTNSSVFPQEVGVCRERQRAQ